MAKLSIIARDKKKEKLVARYAAKRKSVEGSRRLGRCWINFPEVLQLFVYAADANLQVAQVAT